MLRYHSSTFSLMKSNGKLETNVFRKETKSNLYLHWRYYGGSIIWKKGTLKTLTRRVYTVCSNDNLLLEKLHHIET